DRLLARLQTVAPNRWIVKGAVALSFRLGDKARPTKDLDLAFNDGEEAAISDLRAAQDTDLGDFFKFRIERTDDLDEFLEGVAVRFRVRAELAGRPFEVVPLDVGFADPGDLPPTRLNSPDFFTFAGIQPTELLLLPLEQHVAEKVHASTRNYGGRHSSRVKDLIDLVLISSTSAFEAGRLRQAIERAFETRGAQIAPESFPPPPVNWVASYMSLATASGLTPDLEIGHALVAEFLDPVLANMLSSTMQWDPANRAWEEPGDASSPG
ncbi:MAG: nucleotidyl transferase AbiEii/AbiGii toxin family protein, partial [Thermomicrobiales bacterium]